MRLPTITLALAAIAAFPVAPALAQTGHDAHPDAVRAACTTYAQMATETMPSASPRLRSTPPALRPGAPEMGGVQAPGTGRLERSVQAPGTENAAYRQAFDDCMQKLGR